MKKSAFFFVLLCSLFSVLGQDQSVADSLYAVLKKAEKEDSARLSLLGLITQNENVPEKKLEVAQQLLQEATEASNTKFQHNAYLQMGQAHRIQGNFDLAINDLLKALEIAEKSENERGIIATYTALADTYSLFGSYSNAIKYYKKSIEQASESDSSILAVTLLNLGDTYYMLESYDSAFIYFKESKEIYENLGNDPSGIAYNLGNMGLVLAELGELRKAEANVKSAIEELELLGDHYGSCIFLGYMSDIYKNKGLISEAQVFADSCLAIARRFGLKTEVRDNLLRLSSIMEAKGQTADAFQYHKEYVALKDSIASEEIYARIENLQTAYELSQKQAEVDLLKVQRKNQQAVIVTATVVVFAFAVLVIVIFVYYRSKIRVNRMLKRQKVSLERLNETKDKFFSIISHDLRGPVASLFGVGQLIRHFLQEDNKEQLLAMAGHMESSVDRLSTLLDNLLNWAMQQQGHFPNVPEKVNITEMIDEVVDMFSNMSSGKKLDVSSNIDEPIFLWVDRNSIHTVFRNLINNAIKFTPDGGSIKVEASVDHGFAEITVTDSGVGIPKPKLKKLFSLSDKKATFGTAGEKGLGLGLQLVNEFMEMNNGSISAKSEEGKGTTFLVKLPLFDKAEITEKSGV